jgi:hypothetical protein
LSEGGLRKAGTAAAHLAAVFPVPVPGVT